MFNPGHTLKLTDSELLTLERLVRRGIHSCTTSMNPKEAINAEWLKQVLGSMVSELSNQHG